MQLLLLLNSIILVAASKPQQALSIEAAAPAAASPSFFYSYGWLIILLTGLLAVGVGQYLLFKKNESDAVYTLLDVGLAFTILGAALYGGWGCVVIGSILLLLSLYLMHDQGKGTNVYVAGGLGVTFLVIGAILILTASPDPAVISKLKVILPPKTHVTMYGFLGDREIHNGRYGEIKSYEEQSDRYTVYLPETPWNDSFFGYLQDLPLINSIPYVKTMIPRSEITLTGVKPDNIATLTRDGEAKPKAAKKS